MKSNLYYIIRREFMVKVKKRSFLLITFLTPLLILFFMAVVAFFVYSTMSEETEISVWDPAGKISPSLYSSHSMKIQRLPSDMDLATAKKICDSSEHNLLIIPRDMAIDSLSQNISMYGKNSPGDMVLRSLENQLDDILTQMKLRRMDINIDMVDQARTHTRIKILDENDEDVTLKATVAKVVSFVAFFLMYFFVILYGARVMRSVMEEKTSRVVEVMLSSVKPKELMYGKIFGSTLVSFVQFAIWGLMLAVGYAILALLVGNMAHISGGSAPGMNNTEDLALTLEALGELNIGTIVFGFLFYFVFSFLVHSALFAAIGAMVDNQTDSQQFMLPIMLPMMIAFYASFGIVENPDSSMAFWMSIIPITSPMAMMARLPFGVPLWELVLSMGLLVAYFILIVRMSARLYRIGILFSRSKPSYKDVWKWLRQPM